MTRKWRLGAALFVMFAPINATYAEETYPTKQIGRWEVYGWNANCWMRTTSTDGTELSFSWDLESPKLFVMITNRNWLSIQRDRQYSIDVSIDEWSLIERANGYPQSNTMAPGVAFYVSREAEDQFVMKLASGSRLQFSLRGRNVGNYNLHDSGEAVRELITCALSLQPRDENDPFVGE